MSGYCKLNSIHLFTVQRWITRKSNNASSLSLFCAYVIGFFWYTFCFFFAIYMNFLCLFSNWFNFAIILTSLQFSIQLILSYCTNFVLWHFIEDKCSFSCHSLHYHAFVFDVSLGNCTFCFVDFVAPLNRYKTISLK